MSAVSWLIGPYGVDNIVDEPIEDAVLCIFTYNGWDDSNFSATFHHGEGFRYLRGRAAQRAWMKVQQPGTAIRWVSDDRYGRIHPYRVSVEISRARLERLGFL